MRILHLEDDVLDITSHNQAYSARLSGLPSSSPSPLLPPNTFAIGSNTNSTAFAFFEEPRMRKVSIASVPYYTDDDEYIPSEVLDTFYMAVPYVLYYVASITYPRIYFSSHSPFSENFSFQNVSPALLPNVSTNGSVCMGDEYFEDINEIAENDSRMQTANLIVNTFWNSNFNIDTYSQLVYISGKLVADVFGPLNYQNNYKKPFSIDGEESTVYFYRKYQERFPDISSVLRFDWGRFASPDYRKYLLEIGDCTPTPPLSAHAWTPFHGDIGLHLDSVINGHTQLSLNT